MTSRLLTSREQLIITALVGAIFLGSATVWWFNRPRTLPLEIRTQDDAAGPQEAEPLHPQPTAPSEPAAATSTSSAPTVQQAAVVTGSTDAQAESLAQTAAAAGTVEPVLEQASAQVVAEQTPANIGVTVRGAVLRPGFHWLPPDARIQELLDAAGGVLDGADLSDINLSAQLIDRTTLIIPNRGSLQEEGGVLRGRGATRAVNIPEYTISQGNVVRYDPPPAASVAAADVQEAGGKVRRVPSTAPKVQLVDLNTGRLEELESLPGIGPALAKRIMAARPFGQVEDLNSVSGIGPKRFEALKDLVTVGGQ